MIKHRRSLALGVIFWGATNLSQVSLAQYWVPIQPPVPSHDTMFPGVRERSEDKNQESSPAPQIQSPNTSSSTPIQCLPYSQAFNKYMNEMGEIMSGKSNSSRTLADVVTDQGNAMNALAKCIREN
jgi:hypothetical protein